MFWGEAVTAGGWHAAAVVLESELPWQPWWAAGLWSLSAKGALGSWLLLSTFCRCSHRRKPQWKSHCFPPFPPKVPSQTNTGLQRSFWPDSNPCGVFKAMAKGPSLLSASQQPQALHFLFSPSRSGSVREKSVARRG